MSEEPRHLVRNRGMISLLLEIQELRLVVKAQLFDGTLMAVPLSPRPSHRVAPYDVYVMMGSTFRPIMMAFVIEGLPV